MKTYKKFCVVCGRRIPELSLRQKTCSEFCRSRYKCGYAPYKDCTEMPYQDLTALQEEAVRGGISYGKLMALKQAKQQGDDKAMPMRMECPFFNDEKDLKLHCESATIKFPDKDARSEFLLGYCAHSYNWRKCPIAHCLENYYFRKE